MKNSIYRYFNLLNIIIILENHLISESIFEKYHPPGLYENTGTFHITASVVNQKDQEENEE